MQYPVNIRYCIRCTNCVHQSRVADDRVNRDCLRLSRSTRAYPRRGSVPHLRRIRQLPNTKTDSAVRSAKQEISVTATFLDYVAPTSFAALLRQHIGSRATRLTGMDAGWLFPSFRTGRHLHPHGPPQSRRHQPPRCPRDIAAHPRHPGTSSAGRRNARIQLLRRPSPRRTGRTTMGAILRTPKVASVLRAFTTKFPACESTTCRTG